MSRARDVSNIDNIPTAKGDIYAATAASTPARIGVGSNDQVLVSDSTTSTGLAWKSYGAQVVAGKNAIINGAMDVWQRGTTFTATGWSADRWYVNADSGVATTITRSTDAPTGFRYSMKFQRTAGNTATGAHGIGQSFETQESIRFAGKTVTYSFWAKRGANYSGSGNLLEWRVGFSTGTDQSITNAYGGWAGYSEANSPAATLTTSWQRFSMTFNVPSNATQISVRVFQAPTGTAGADDSYFVTGFQFEESATATPFSRAGGTITGELAACYRYFWRYTTENSWSNFTPFASGHAYSVNNARVAYQFPVQMRIAPTQTFTAANTFLRGWGNALTSIISAEIGTQSASFDVVRTNEFNVWDAVTVTANNNKTAYIELSAEL